MAPQSTKHMSRRHFLAAAATSLGGVVLAACGGSGTNAGTNGAASGGTASGGTLKWASWGNPGEAQRFQDYTKDWNTKNASNQAEFILIPNDGYEAKLLTQLNGGTAPDVFYAGDGTIGKLIANKTIVDLTDQLNGPNSKSKPTDFAEGLWGAGKDPAGRIWGVAVDCNPMVLWYNKKLLQDVGVTEMPADTYAAGNWNRDAFTAILEKLVAKQKYGFVLENWWAPYYSWISTNGGKMYENEKFVANEDAKSLDAFKYIADSVQKKLITYAGGLPKGQGVDAMFVSQQVGFVGAGRWLLPVFSKASGLDFDIVPYPSNTGEKLAPAGIATAYLVVNAKAKNPQGAFDFLTNFVSAAGQTFRLQGGGNAVPSITGPDQVVLEGNSPAHAQTFLDVRKVGYANYATETRVPGLGDDINKTLDVFFLKGGDVKQVLDQIADNANKKIAANKA